MSSLEIAELTGKQHGHVMRDIRAMLVDLHGEGGVSKFGDTRQNPQNGQSYAVFLLPKRETLVLVSGYSVELRARIVDRWQALEAAVAAPAPTVPALVETLATAVDRGLMSRRSAVARLDASLGIVLPRRAASARRGVGSVDTLAAQPRPAIAPPAGRAPRPRPPLSPSACCPPRRAVSTA
jgi:hypothetical protein